MLLYFYALSINFILFVSSENVQAAQIHGKDEKTKNIEKIIINAKPIVNVTYIEKEENMLKMPTIKKDYEEIKKKKIKKKSAKRTIQKIIKKNRTKRKYMNMATNAPTKAPLDGEDLESYYAQEDIAQKNENLTTTQVNQKKTRKYNAKIARYPKPFQKMASMKERKRNKRSEERSGDRDMFILTDLDEMEFQKSEKDQDVIRAIGKPYW